MQKPLPIANVWQSIRLVLLMLICGSALFVMGKALVTPRTKAAPPPYALPTNVSLPDWQTVSSAPLPPIPESIASRQYEYRHGTKSVHVEMRYMLGDGDVNRFLFIFTPIRQGNVRLVIKHQSRVGFYGVLPDRGRAYLSACINPRGESTVTEHQFAQNRHAYDLKAARVLPWLLGQQPLLDRRCLWTLMSVPLPTASDSAALTEAYESLENAWFAWYDWWQPHFPPV